MKIKGFPLPDVTSWGGDLCLRVETLRQNAHDSMTERLSSYELIPKTPGCITPKHPHLLPQNIRVFWGNTSGCFYLKDGDVLPFQYRTWRH